jgi:hypothetical protein
MGAGDLAAVRACGLEVEAVVVAGGVGSGFLEDAGVDALMGNGF